MLKKSGKIFQLKNDCVSYKNKKLLLIDNYDSFTYNLVHYFSSFELQIQVKKNDQLSLVDVSIFNPDYIVISPGPGKPQNAGLSLAIINTYAHKIPILGICLGHQCIAHNFGAKITFAKRMMHGESSIIMHNNTHIFSNIPVKFSVLRYHSLLVDVDTLPQCFDIIAWTNFICKTERIIEIMAIQHKFFPLVGLQFHPESFLSENGLELMHNFLQNYL